MWFIKFRSCLARVIQVFHCKGRTLINFGKIIPHLRSSFGFLRLLVYHFVKKATKKLKRYHCFNVVQQYKRTFLKPIFCSYVHTKMFGNHFRKIINLIKILFPIPFQTHLEQKTICRQNSFVIALLRNPIKCTNAFRWSHGV